MSPGDSAPGDSTPGDSARDAEELVATIAKKADGRRGVLARDAAEELLNASRQTQAEALLRLGRILQDGSHSWHVQGSFQDLMKRKLPLDEEEIVEILGWSHQVAPFAHYIATLERYLKASECSARLRDAIVEFRDAVARSFDPKKHDNDVRIAKLLGEEVHESPLRDLDTSQRCVARMVDDLEQLRPPHDEALTNLVVHAGKATGGKPNAKWRGAARKLLEPIPRDLVESSLLVWFAAFDEPGDPGNAYPGAEWAVPEGNGDLLKGLLWMTPDLASEEMIRGVAAIGLAGQRKIPGVGPRSSKVTNAAIWALGNTDHALAIAQLAILRSRIRNKAVQKQIDKAMAATAERLGVSETEVEELAVPTFGLSDVGAHDVTLGGFTAELRVTGTGSASIGWRTPAGKAQKSVPKSVKEAHADELKDLKATAKDVAKLLPSQRDRIDKLHLGQASWPVTAWRERYLDHVLVGTLARRLIWTLTDPDGGRRRTACWANGALVDSEGAPVEVDEAADHVSLWHPIGRPEDETQGWRTFFEERGIAQPFKQAHREVYVLTDAERTTGVYSNRYAAHILKQHQFNALCAVRGWSNSLRLMVDDDYPPATLDLPEWNLRAEFWVEGLGDEYGRDTTESGTYLYLATDQVRFYDLDAARHIAHASGGGYSTTHGAPGAEPIPLDRIDPLVLSEVMRDIDLFVGVASVGNDPTWQDGGGDATRQGYWQGYSFGELSGTAKTRKEQLQRLVPRLKIADRCSFQDRFLVVRGDRRTYRVHLGSGNILMDPNDQYLCIVPGRGAVSGPAAKVHLPFEGDRTLSIILSKAFLLAEDAKITDPTIVSQIA
ncbi:MAG: DUF4132 domain-containing protein [Planctomycetota bacterium]